MNKHSSFAWKKTASAVEEESSPTSSQYMKRTLTSAFSFSHRDEPATQSVAVKRITSKKKHAYYSSALDNVDEDDLLNMDKAIIGLSKSIYRFESPGSTLRMLGGEKRPHSTKERTQQRELRRHLKSVKSEDDLLPTRPEAATTRPAVKSAQFGSQYHKLRSSVSSVDVRNGRGGGGIAMLAIPKQNPAMVQLMRDQDSDDGVTTPAAQPRTSPEMSQLPISRDDSDLSAEALGAADVTIDDFSVTSSVNENDETASSISFVDDDESSSDVSMSSKRFGSFVSGVSGAVKQLRNAVDPNIIITTPSTKKGELLALRTVRSRNKNRLTLTTLASTPQTQAPSIESQTTPPGKRRKEFWRMQSTGSAKFSDKSFDGSLGERSAARGPLPEVRESEEFRMSVDIATSTQQNDPTRAFSKEIESFDMVSDKGSSFYSASTRSHQTPPQPAVAPRVDVVEKEPVCYCSCLPQVKDNASTETIVIPPEERVARAAIHLRDAMHERPIKFHRTGMRAVLAYSILHSKPWGLFLRALIVLHLALALWEPPSFRTDGQYPTSFAVFDCSGIYDDDVGTYDDDVMDPSRCFQRTVGYARGKYAMLRLEIAIIGVYMIDAALGIYCFGFADFFGMPTKDLISASNPLSGSRGMESPAVKRQRHWDAVRAFCLIVMAFDVLLSWFSVSPLRLSRVLRPVLFVYKSRELRRWLYLIVTTLPRIVGLALLIFSFITVYAIIGVLLFSQKDYYKGPEFQYANFDGFGSACIALYVLMTSENYPYIMYPPYDSGVKGGSHYYAFFYVSFLLIVMFFLSNLAVPYLFSTFKKSHLNEALSGRIIERTALLASFQLLDIENRGFVYFDRFIELAKIVRGDLFYADGREKKVGLTRFIFDELCATESGRCYPLDYFQVLEVLLTEFELQKPARLARDVSSLHFAGPALFDHTNILAYTRSFLKSTWFEKFVLLLVFVNTVTLCCYARGNDKNALIILVSDVFIFIFTFEILMKVTVMRFRRFCSAPYNIFDIIVILVAFSFTVAKYCGKPVFAEAGSVIISVRALRLIPALGIFNKLNVILKIMPFMYFSMLSLFFFIYIFAIVGTEAFAERYRHSRTIETYSDINIQFDNFVGAVMALFQVLTSNNWDEIMYTGMFSTGLVALPALYFILFHFIAVTLLLQLVIAIYVEAFETYQERKLDEPDSASMSTKAPSSNQPPPLSDKGGGKKMHRTASAVSVASAKSNKSNKSLKKKLRRRQSKVIGSRTASAKANSAASRPVIQQAESQMYRRTSLAPKSPIHTLARVYMKEFEDSEIREIQALGDVDMEKEISMRSEYSKLVMGGGSSIGSRDMALMALNRSSTRFNSMQGSFDQSSPSRPGSQRYSPVSHLTTSQPSGSIT